MRFLPLFLLAGCAGSMAEIPTSRALLSLDDSSATLKLPPVAAARELLADMAPAGFALANETDTQGAIIVKFTRQNLIGLGSAVYAWIRPAPGGSTISFVGKPTLLGEEGCSEYTPGQACNQQLSDDAEELGDYMTGGPEADAIHGVLATLRLKGVVLGPAPESAAPSAPATAADPVCLAQRHAVFAQAAAVSGSQAKAAILATAPACPLAPI
ncbi:MAG TPA: hypothetical protein VGM88_32945 [Kofleriaceae bacterium]|jgi:hypothetical protein